MSISNFCHGTNHYHLVRLYDASSTFNINPQDYAENSGGVRQKNIKTMIHT